VSSRFELPPLIFYYFWILGGPLLAGGGGGDFFPLSSEPEFSLSLPDFGFCYS